MRTTRILALGLLLIMALTGCNGENGGGVATAGGGASSTASTGQVSDHEQAVRYAQCLRDNGIEVADPEDGHPPAIEQGTAPADEVKAATEACKQYAPTLDKPKMDTEQLEKLRQIAQCMRENGYPDFPDPDADEGGITIDDDSGIDTKSPDFTAAQQKCGMDGPPPSDAGQGGTG